MSNWSRRFAVVGVAATGLLGISAVAGLAAEPLPTATASQFGGRGQALGSSGYVGVSESSAPANGTGYWSGLSVYNSQVIGRNGDDWYGAAVSVLPSHAAQRAPGFGCDAEASAALASIAVANGDNTTVTPIGGAEDSTGC